jgi:S1-C subfamily serine protease
MKRVILLFVTFILTLGNAYSQNIDYQKTMIKNGLVIKDNTGVFEFTFYDDLTGYFIATVKKSFGRQEKIKKNFNYSKFYDNGKTTITYNSSSGFVRWNLSVYFNGMYATIADNRGKYEEAVIVFPQRNNFVVKNTNNEVKPKKILPGIDNNKIVPAASGTGFFVSYVGHIISNHHVVEGCNSTKLNFNGKEINVAILATDKKNDLAILKAEVKPKKVYSVAFEDSSLLEDIIIAGYPLGKKVSAAIKTSKEVLQLLQDTEITIQNFKQMLL